MENEKFFPEYEKWVEWMLEDFRKEHPDWTTASEVSLGEIYSMTYRYLEVHPQRRILAMLVLNRLLPDW